jgi:hypothetical protein
MLSGLPGLAACGDDGGGDDDGGVEPKLIMGGGVADGPIAGVLHVHVVEQETNRPIMGATVTTPSGIGLTDASGRVTVNGVTGPQTVSASANGRAAATWFGVAGANVTLPLQLSRPVPVAHVIGTIAGWGGLPVPGLNHYTLGVVLYSFLEDPTAPENAISQLDPNGAPVNLCVRTAISGSTCAWQLNARVGKQIHTAVIVDGDTRGTTDTADDTYTLIGYAAGDVVTLTEGQQITAESLAMVTGTQQLSVVFPTAPAGLPNIVAIPELQLADGSGRVVLPLPPLSAATPTKAVLAPTGKFSGTYEVVALATANATANAPFSTSFVHNVTASATLPAWLAPPSGLSRGASYSFTAAAGAAFHTAQITRANAPLWNITILDGSSTFTLPALSPDPLAGGGGTLSLTAADVPGFDPAKFDVPGLKPRLARAAGAELAF